MKTLLLLSILIALVAIPLFAARLSSPRRALGRIAFWFSLTAVFYLLALRLIYPRLL